MTSLARGISSIDRRKMTDQQVLFMSPQTENLEYLYSLMDRISQQMTGNKKKRADLLREIDVLVNEVNRSGNKQRAHDPNVGVIRNFLKHRNVDLEEITEPNDEEDKELRQLRMQNTELKKMLVDKCHSNNETLSLLKVHENYLSDVVSLLRRDVLSYHQELIGKCRLLYEDRVCTLEDSEFKAYMENISDLQELLDVSQVFRMLLRVAA